MKTEPPKRGRPVTTGGTPHVKFRCPSDLQAEIEQAARVNSETITDFWLIAARERIKRLKRRVNK